MPAVLICLHIEGQATWAEMSMTETHQGMRILDLYTVQINMPTKDWEFEEHDHSHATL